ncbi:MAG: DEAD/DEAH box helicase [Acidimicrobiales bacterium]|nr:DEAD/DEAH box helicase [Acidimicrobiales bacterium]RZV46181.1 MAG: DEAD/DEAH box helicase [Acidimicrobiales bacterium]
MSIDAVANFSPAVAEWFSTSFADATPPQREGWPSIVSGENTLILSPTGSGKTLAAFMSGIDRLMSEPVPEREHRTRLLYISPLRALAVDVEKNLRSPLRGIALAAERLGEPVHLPTVGMRTGDTPTNERRQLIRNPPDLLITTPESLYLMLTSAARETLRNVDAVIIDEIHSVAGTKRGAHLALTLERLQHLTGGTLQRIGLSATQRPLDEIARFLGGRHTVDGATTWRPVSVIDTSTKPNIDVEVIVPLDDMAEPGDSGIWPAVHPQILEQVRAHTSTIVFVNSRRLAERLAGRLNELWEEDDVAKGLEPPGEAEFRIAAHHGSLSKERRLIIEDQLKNGGLRAIVATSSLELGIDMGAVDLVIQVESPGAVSRGLQRIGRAGHQVGAVSQGKIFPKHRADLLETAVVVKRMADAEIEHTRYLRNPLDVLAQQVVAMTALDDWAVSEMTEVVRGAATFAELSDEVFTNVLDLLAGRYPSEEFSELRPRIVWDRVADMIRGRKGAQRLAVTNAGTIPDRGLFGVFLPDGTRVGELDEEMVYESRPGETFLLGASTWRIEQITFERVIVTPAPGEPGKMPFWHGDGPGRPLELGQALGAFVREIQTLDEDAATAQLTAAHGLDELAAQNLLMYLADQREATGVVPDDRTIVVERFRDEIGDWRVCLLSPFGAQVHAPWGMALRTRLSELWGMDVEMMWSDDGIVIRLPEAFDDVALDDLRFAPDDVEQVVVNELPASALFASRFRESAARALLLPRRRPDQRTPLWQQRQRSADLLRVASKYPTFPILLEATRECLNDVFDVPALREVLHGLATRKIRMIGVETQRASPFAQSLLFGWIAVYMYEGDAPMAERRAAALSLDRELLRDLLGAEELRELLDPAVLADVELELQRLVDGRRARDGDEIHDLLRTLGPLDVQEIDARAVEACDVQAELDALVRDIRVIEIGIGKDRRFAAAEDAGRLRDALGVAIPQGLPAAFTDAIDDPLGDLAMRFARTHAPFTVEQFAGRYGVPTERAVSTLDSLVTDGRLVRGEFRPDGTTREWVDEGVLRQLRRRSLAALRAEVAPVERVALARFVTAWQGVGVRRRGPDGLAEVIAVLQGAALPASVLETSILPARMAEYRASELDTLCTSGEVVWVGAGAIGANDGRIRLAFRDQVALLVSASDDVPDEPIHDLLRGHFGAVGASFWHEMVTAVSAAGDSYTDAAVLAALWDLVWAGEVTNDSLAPVRAYTSARAKRMAATPRRRPKLGQARASGPPTATGRWSLVAPLLQPSPSSTQSTTARALQLIERYGVLTREAALGEGIAGGFAGVYPVLKVLEERGDVRRGYFVEGLGAAQFALPGAVDRLRSMSDAPEESNAVVLAATDPAQPYGASLRWPDTSGRPARVAGAYVILVDGEPAVFVERRAKSIVAFDVAHKSSSWVDALKTLVTDRLIRSLEIERIDGEPASASPLAETLTQHGFARGYKGYAWQPPRKEKKGV